MKEVSQIEKQIQSLKNNVNSAVDKRQWYIANEEALALFTKIIINLLMSYHAAKANALSPQATNAMTRLMQLNMEILNMIELAMGKAFVVQKIADGTIMSCFERMGREFALGLNNINVSIMEQTPVDWQPTMKPIVENAIREAGLAQADIFRSNLAQLRVSIQEEVDKHEKENRRRK